MDKLKESLGPVAKHFFWIACGTIVLIGMATWFLATGSLKELTAANKSKIDASFSTAQSISTTGTSETGGRPIHPNDKTHEATEDLINRLKVRVGKAWAKQYEKQQDNLVWPDELEAGVKSQVTKLLEVPVWQFEVDGKLIRIEGERDKNRAIRKLKREHGVDKEVSELQDAGEYLPVNLPIEKAIEFDPAGATSNKELLTTELETYGRFIREYVPTLADKIGAKWEEGRSKSTTGSADEDVTPPTVIWNEKNQRALFNKLTLFPGREDENNIPTTLQMLYAQEDLWVLEALLDIIAATNTKARGNWDASVKQIEFIEFGAGTLALTGAITEVGDGFADPGIGTDDEPATTSAQSGGVGATTEQIPDPAERRYVDTKFQPLSASDLRDSYDSTNPDLAVLSVAKRLPIRMSLVMKQTDVPKFLVACRASKLPVEIRQVRFNKTGEAAPTRGVGRTQEAGDTFGGGFSSGGDDPSASAGYGAGADADGGGGGAFEFDSGGETGFETKPEVDDASVSSDRMPIEFYGVIYIYNPPNTEKLQVDQEFVESLAKEEETAPTEEPPATP